MSGKHIFTPKHPQAQLDYQFDWAGKSNNTGMTDWLETGETILSHEVTVSGGITLVSSAIIKDGTAVIFWVSGGSDNQDYQISCRITTATRTDVKTAVLPVRIKS